MRKSIFLLFALALSTSLTAQSVTEPNWTAMDAETLHRDAPVVDTHNDLLMLVARRPEGQQAAYFRDHWLPQLRAGGVDVQVLPVFIDDDYRGRGVGGALLGEVLDRIPRLELDVNEQNPDAVAFYRRHGFVIVGRSEIDADGRPFPLLRMVSSAAST